MRIGILTLHSQLNYGGVLQSLALQTALEKLGHDVVVLDWWFSENNYRLIGSYKKWGFRRWVAFLVRAFLGCGDLGLFLRHLKTRLYIKRNLNLTPYSFYCWSEFPSSAHLDRIVVGSDQVWHSGDWGYIETTLLEAAPNIQAISYAASFGMPCLPEDYRESYRRGFQRFRAISCREMEGVRIVNELGYNATHVVDPTLLSYVPKNYADSENRLVCYFLKIPPKSVLPILKSFCKARHCFVDIFVDPFTPIQWMHPNMRIKIHYSASPKEFLAFIKKGRWILSDSFHGLMFSAKYRKNVRIVRPKTQDRAIMFARIEEFSSRFTHGSVIVDSVDDAIRSFLRNECTEWKCAELYKWVEASNRWLQENI